MSFFSSCYRSEIPGRPIAAATLALAAVCGSGPVSAAEAADPGASLPRSTVTTGADIADAGNWEIELGVQRLGGNNADRRSSVSTVFKYSLDDRFALIVGGEPYVATAPTGAPRFSGAGDTVLTLKYRAPDVPDGQALGLEASVKFPTAAGTGGTGRRDYGLIGIYGTELPHGFHLDTNLGLTYLGARSAGQGRYQTSWSAAVSHLAGDAWTVAAELSGTRQPGVASTTQALVAASYAASKRVTLDAGAAAGLNRATPRWTIFAGMTILIGAGN